MKTTYLTLLAAVLGGSLSFAASINGMDSSYSKGYTIYDGSNGDTLNISSPSVPVHTGSGATPWTMALTISDLGTTSGTDVGLLFTYNTTSNYKNLEGMGYRLTESGDLTLCAGGFNYNGGTAGTSPWKTQTLSGYSAGQALTLFYTYNDGNVTISAMLGDMLIGEALSVTSSSGCNGVIIQYDGSGNAILKDLSMDGTGSYAPPTSGLVNEENAFISAGADSGGSSGTPEGNIAWPETGFTHYAANQNCSGVFDARAQADASSGRLGNSVNVTITSGNATHVYASTGNYTGDVWLTIAKEGQASAWYGAHGNSGTLNGNAALRFTDAATGGSTVFGAVNASGVTGNVYLEFSAENASFGTFTSNNASSVVGSYATDIKGNVDIVINSGSFSSQIMGGIYANANNGTTTIGGATHVYVNGGSINGDVMGGGLAGSISGGSNATVTGGVIAGSVYGAGKGGSIREGSAVRVTGGTIKGDVYAGGSGGTVQGNTSVTVAGNSATLHNGKSWSSISGGGSGGAVNGSSIVRIQDLSSGTAAYGFDKYAGTISGGTNVSGGRSLVLDHVTVEHFQASLSDFTHVSAVNQTRTTLDSLGGALTVTIEAGSGLVLNGVSDMTTLILGEHASLTLQGLTADKVIVDITGTSHYTLSLTEIPASLDNIKFLNNGVLYDAAMSTDPQANSAMVFAQAPEPGSASLGLAGLAALLWRRRRKIFH